jgi:hypothetical protein
MICDSMMDETRPEVRDASDSGGFIEAVAPSSRLERLVRRLGVDFECASAAYHEAGHAVAGFWYGWVIAPEGLEIDQHQRCCFSCAAFAYTIEARAVLAMTGWLSELKWHKQGSIDRESELIRILDGHNWGQVSVDYEDCRQVVKALVGSREPANVETKELLFAIYALRQYALELIARPPFWRAIRRVARELLAKGKLSDTEVVKAIGERDFMDVSHGRWTKDSASLPESLEYVSAAESR